MMQLPFLFIAALSTLSADGNEIMMYGIKGHSVQLLCDVPVATPPLVEWSDMVYTSDTNPSIIFRSENNPHFHIASSHQNQANYNVHSNFALTIDSLKMDYDPGQYTCKSVVDGKVHERIYYLTVGDSPSCSGNGHLFEGNSTTFSCELTYSGRNPSLQWFYNGKEIESVDEYEVRLAKKVVSVIATPELDQAQYTCRMSLGDVTEECNVVLDVKYLVRDLKLSPTKEKFRVGDELHCSAKGNPLPSIVLSPFHEKSGSGWKSLGISPTWEGQRMNVQCTASNTVGTVTETQFLNLTIHVSTPRKSVTTTSSPVIEKHRTFHHHARHSSTSPPVMRKEKDQTRPGGHHRKPNHQHHHSTTASMLIQDQQEVQRNPFGGDDNQPEKTPVTHRAGHEKADQPEIRQADTKDSQKDSRAAKSTDAPQVAGAKPVQGKTNHADRMNNLSLFSAVVLLLNLILTVF